MKRDRLYVLLSAYINEKICDDDLNELISYVKTAQENSVLYDVIDEIWKELNEDKALPPNSDLVYQKIINSPGFISETEIIPKASSWNIQRLLKITAAAAVFFVVLSLFFYKNYFASTPSHQQEEVLPGSKKAILTLNNGKAIFLDDVSKGTIADENGTIIKKNNEGELVYEAAKSGESTESPGSRSAMNTITTPNGGEFQVILPDGSKVWLNAASSLTFPARFSEDSREVKLVGEAYFEIVHKIGKGLKTPDLIPFVVNTNSQRINVLGTKFNVKSYKEDDYSNTALIEGKVRISIPDATKTGQNVTTRILIPGEKATIQHGDKNIEVGAFVKEEILAWKNGYFFFDNENIKSVMTTIARWYDVEVSYQGNPESVFFDGTISRFDSIEKLLKTISLTGSVKFKLSERRIIVMI